MQGRSKTRSSVERNNSLRYEVGCKPPRGAVRAYPAMIRFFLLLLMFWATPAFALDTVTLQLKWRHQFQFAGYYAAKEKGYYREAGLDVNIVEAIPGIDPIDNVLSGKAQYGVGTSSLLLLRSSGKPVVALGVIFQHSAYILLARQDSPTQSIHDLVGKRLMLEPQSEEVLAYLKKEGIPLKSITLVEHSYDPRDLINGKVDVFLGYVTDETYYLDRAHFPYHAYTPRSAGIDFYGDNLFTTEQELKAHPDQVKAFREASLRGWHYAMNHHEEIADLILAKYAQRHDRDYLLNEAKQMMSLVNPDMIEIGYMSPGRWRHIADTYAYLGMLPDNSSFDGFLYNPNPQHDLTWFYRGLAGALLVIVIVSAVAIRFARLSIALRRAEQERQVAQEQTRASEARYHDLFLNMTGGFAQQEVVRSADGSILDFRFIEVNPVFAKMTGTSRDKLIGKCVNEALPEARDCWVENLGKVASTGEPNRFELYMKSAGRWFAVYAYSTVPGQFGVLVQDITENRQAEADLKRSEEKFRSIYEGSTNAVMLLTKNGFFDCNARTLEIFGLKDKTEFFAYHPADLSPPFQPDGKDSLSAANEKIMTALKEGSTRFEWIHRRKNGEDFPAEVLFSAFDYGGERVLQATIRDITDQKEVEKSLVEAKEKSEQANFAKSEFLARMSHELRTPMTSVLGFSELVISNPDEPLTFAQREGLTYIMESGRHLLGLINEILDLAQIESGNINIELRPVAVKQMIENVFTLVRPIAERDRIHLSISEKVDREYFVLADKTRLRQALLNLVSNAVKYNRTDGFVSASLQEERKGFLRITIHDTGEGIPEKLQPLLFEPFERLGKENSGIGGAGVGLTITRRLIQLMNGSIGYKSSPGAGSSFYVELPVCDEPPESESATEINAMPPLALDQKYTVLYVEDNYDNLNLIKKIFLRRPFINLISAPDARIGIDLARTYRPDLILMDINLPGMDGVTAMKHLKTIKETKDIPVIALSGNALRSEINKALKEGFVHYITKPIKVSEFLDTVDRFLKVV